MLSRATSPEFNDHGVVLATVSYFIRNGRYTDLDGVKVYIDGVVTVTTNSKKTKELFCTSSLAG